MIKKIDHIGIAVKNIHLSNQKWRDILGFSYIKQEKIEEQGVYVSIFQMQPQNIKIELIAPIDETSSVYKFLEKRGEGLHHICFEVENIKGVIEKFASMGFEIIDKEPRRGEGGSLIAFIHPKSTNCVLIELKENTKKK